MIVLDNLEGPYIRVLQSRNISWLQSKKEMWGQKQGQRNVTQLALNEEEGMNKECRWSLEKAKKWILPCGLQESMQSWRHFHFLTP